MIFNWRQQRSSRARSAERRRPLFRGTWIVPRGSRSSAASGDKRSNGRRVTLAGQVRGEVMVFQPMSIVDISRGGVQIETTFGLSAESLHDFRLSLADRVIIVRGRIAYCQIGQLTDASALYRSGVAFVDLSPHARHVLDDFIGAVQAGSAAASGL